MAADERVAINDNRRAAGALSANVLTIRLEVRTGEWHPEGEGDSGLTVRAFATDDGPLQIPAPLIRVVEGTTIVARIHNTLDVQLFVHGLSTRPAQETNGFVRLAPGETREIRFPAGAPGTYFYWAATTNEPDQGRRSEFDGQLSGGFIVDPKGETPNDRVLIATSWNARRVVDGQEVQVGRLVFNGKSWPHTERLAYDVGEKVRLRVLNVGGQVHTMHLHGFYFNVDSRGDEVADTIFPVGSSPHLENTERLPGGRTFSLTWTPTRVGNWLFHCHDTVHIVKRRLLDGRPVPLPVHDHEVNHALEMMAGPVIGITVRSTASAAAVPEPETRRRLRLVARVDSGGTDDEPAYGFTLEDGSRSMPSGPPYLPGPTIVLKRGEPVSITVENRLPEPTGVHWHGIELESYFDGVPGFSGGADRLTPSIMPGQSFEARFTPPRAGTFIYHSHADELRQQQAGLTGALIVVDDPASYDPTHDIVVLVSAPRRIADDANVLINGAFSAPRREMRVGERYRFRLINVHVSRPNMRISLIHDGGPLTWRALAKDGFELPADQATEQPSRQQVGNGETFDFEFAPTVRGDYSLEVRSVGDLLLATMPAHVN
jgi:FtsP/CotA-like multicopper oxidase with cupredoxin domain